MKRLKKIIKNNKFIYNVYLKYKHKRRTAKLGISYSVFDGLEMLYASLKSVRESADYINIIYQNISFHGQKGNQKDLQYLYYLKNIGLCDEILVYKNKDNKTPVWNETKKRNIGLKYCKKNKCKYFLSMDVDEFYFKKQFTEARNYICDYGIKASACLFYCYVKKPIYKFCEPRKKIAVPFIFKINAFSKIKPYNWFICNIDDSRVLNINNKKRVKILLPHIIAMHHMSYIRLDYNKKFINTSARDKDSNISINTKQFIKRVNKYSFPNKIELFDGEVYSVEIVDDYFSINESIKNYINFKSNKRKL